MVTIQKMVPPTVAPQAIIPFTDKEGRLSNHAKQFLQQLYNNQAGTNRVLPCNSANTSNQYNLTISAPKQLVYNAYATHDTFGFVAPATSTGLVTAQVITPTGSLATVPVYKQNGAAQATTGDVVQNLHYLLTFVDSLNGGLGGFVIR